MKKTGFTLAEVLITLAIIGVVATMTLPALMTNTQEQQAKTGLKKMINTLTIAAESNNANNGFDFNSIASTSTTDSDTDLSIYRLLRDNTLVDYNYSHAGAGNLRTLGGTGNMGANNYTVFFKDGTAMSYNASLLSNATNPRRIQKDGEPYGFPVLVDINGIKGPNILSNCDNNGSPTATGATTDKADGSALTICNQKNNRVIRDQFSVRLRGSSAIPNGPASRWAYNN